MFGDDQLLLSLLSANSSSVSTHLLQHQNSQFLVESQKAPSGDSIDPIYAQFRDQSRFWVQRVAVPLIMVIGLFGNLITVIIMTRRRMRSTTNLYLAALAFVDMLYLVLTFILGLSHYPNMAEKKYLIYWSLRPFLMMLTDACSNTSVWLTVTFTIERFIAVRYPMKGKVWCTEARAKKLIAGVFVFAIIFVLPVPFEWKVIERHVKTTSGKANLTSINNEDAQQQRQLQEETIMLGLENTTFGLDETYKTIYYRLTAVLFYFLPLLSVTLFNFFLIHSVHRSKKERKRMTNQQSQKQPALVATTAAPPQAIGNTKLESDQCLKEFSDLSSPSNGRSLDYDNQPNQQKQAQRNKGLRQKKFAEFLFSSKESQPNAGATSTTLNGACSKRLPQVKNQKLSGGLPRRAPLPTDSLQNEQEKISKLNLIKIRIRSHEPDDNASPAEPLPGTVHRKGNCDNVTSQVGVTASHVAPTMTNSTKQWAAPVLLLETAIDTCMSTPSNQTFISCQNEPSNGTGPKRTQVAASTNATTMSADSTEINELRDNGTENSSGLPGPRSLVAMLAAPSAPPEALNDKGLAARTISCAQDTTTATTNQSYHCGSNSSVSIPSASTATNALGHTGSNSNTNTGASGPVIAASSQERRITVMLIAVILLFLVCQIPSAAMLLYTSVYETRPNTNEHALLLALGNIFNFLMAINAAGNFILYSFLSKKYRRTFVILFCNCFGKQLARQKSICHRPLQSNLTSGYPSTLAKSCSTSTPGNLNGASSSSNNNTSSRRPVGNNVRFTRHIGLTNLKSASSNNSVTQNTETSQSVHSDSMLQRPAVV